MGLYDAEKIRCILEIPEEQEIVAVIGVGYTESNPEMPKRKEVEEIICFK